MVDTAESLQLAVRELQRDYPGLNPRDLHKALHKGATKGRFKHGVRKAAHDATMQAVRDAVAAIAAIALQDSSHISEANIPVGTEESVAVVTPPASPARPAVSPAM